MMSHIFYQIYLTTYYKVLIIFLHSPPTLNSKILFYPCYNVVYMCDIMLVLVTHHKFLQFCSTYTILTWQPSHQVKIWNILKHYSLLLISTSFSVNGLDTNHNSQQSLSEILSRNITVKMLNGVRNTKNTTSYFFV